MASILVIIRNKNKEKNFHKLSLFLLTGTPLPTVVNPALVSTGFALLT